MLYNFSLSLHNRNFFKNQPCSDGREPQSSDLPVLTLRALEPRAVPADQGDALSSRDAEPHICRSGSEAQWLSVLSHCAPVQYFI